jgi:hypothetical protein
MTLKEFKALKEFKTEFNELLGFDCEIVEYTIERSNYDIDKKVLATSLVFDENKAVRALMNEAEKGDSYTFRKVKAICPGDDEPRKLDRIWIEIKHY